MNYVMRAKMYLESLVSQENQNLENNAATEKITSNESIPIGISSMQSGMDVVSGPPLMVMNRSLLLMLDRTTQHHS